MTALDTYLARQPDAMQPLVRELDALIRAAAPALEPSLKWGNLTYHHTTNVCALVMHARHVNLQIWGATTLADPAGLLAGSGKAMRHIRIVPGEPIDVPAVSAVVRDAAAALARA